MDEPKEFSKDPGGRDESRSFGPVVIALIVALVALMAGWHFYNRKWLGRTFGADVEFTQAPKTAQPGQASQFIVHVEQDNIDRPLPGRVMNIQISPREKAQILSVSGSSGTTYPVQGTGARGRTDSLGNVKIVVRAVDTGQYTLVALDSASEKEGTVDFQVSMAEEGE